MLQWALSQNRVEDFYVESEEFDCYQMDQRVRAFPVR